MIRFNCPNCGRRYELPDLMAHLPLLCKGCGQPLQVPDPDPAPDPPPVFRPANPDPHKTVPPEKVETGTGADSTGGPARTDTASAGGGDDVLVAKPDSSPHIDFNVPGPTVASIGDPKKAWPRPPAPTPAPPAAPGRSKVIPVVVDVAVGLILLAVGVFVGEVLAQKSTREVLTEAGSAARFPPLELIQWLGPPLFFGLVYVLLASRGRSVGGWLKRRAAG